MYFLYVPMFVIEGFSKQLKQVTRTIIGSLVNRFEDS